MSQQPVASIQEAPAPKHPIAFIFHFAFKARGAARSSAVRSTACCEGRVSCLHLRVAVAHGPRRAAVCVRAGGLRGLLFLSDSCSAAVFCVRCVLKCINRRLLIFRCFLVGGRVLVGF